MSVVVEMAGIPGSGKSTLRAEVNRRLVEMVGPGVVVEASSYGGVGENPLQGVPRRLRTAVRYRRALCIATRSLHQGNRPLGQKAQALRFLLSTYDRYRWARSMSHDTLVLLDEGVVQRCFLLFVEATGVSDRYLQRYLAVCPAPDAVILMETDPDEAMARLTKRARGLPPRFEAVREGQALDAFADGGRILNDVAMQFARTHSTEVLPVDSNESIAAVRLAENLAGLLPRPGRT